MTLYLLLIVAANVGLGYAFIVYLNRRARLLAWAAQHVPAVSNACSLQQLPLGDARQLKATIDDGLAQVTRETPVESQIADATPGGGKPAEELAATH